MLKSVVCVGCVVCVGFSFAYFGFLTLFYNTSVGVIRCMCWGKAKWKNWGKSNKVKYMEIRNYKKKISVVCVVYVGFLKNFRQKVTKTNGYNGCPTHTTYTTLTTDVSKRNFLALFLVFFSGFLSKPTHTTHTTASRSVGTTFLKVVNNS